MPRFVKDSRIAAPREHVFAFFERPDALELLTPPGEAVEIIQPPSSLEVGTRVVIRVKVGPFPVEWVAEHVEYIPGRLFVDRQVRGPFASWSHRHEFDDDEAGGTIIRDVVDYEPPLGFIGSMIGGKFLEEKLRAMFEHRHEVVRRFCESPDEPAADRPALSK